MGKALFLSLVCTSSLLLAVDRSSLGYVDHLTEDEIQWLEAEAEKYPALYFGDAEDDGLVEVEEEESLQGE